MGDARDEYVAQGLKFPKWLEDHAHLGIDIAKEWKDIGWSGGLYEETKRWLDDVRPVSGLLTDLRLLTDLTSNDNLLLHTLEKITETDIIWKPEPESDPKNFDLVEVESEHSLQQAWAEFHKALAELRECRASWHSGGARKDSGRREKAEGLISPLTAFTKIVNSLEQQISNHIKALEQRSDVFDLAHNGERTWNPIEWNRVLEAQQELNEIVWPSTMQALHLAENVAETGSVFRVKDWEFADLRRNWLHGDTYRPFGKRLLKKVLAALEEKPPLNLKGFQEYQKKMEKLDVKVNFFCKDAMRLLRRVGVPTEILNI
ncbi:hypothetical protein T439DRAFT_354962 [Meredithblackwellia eburnea MCA 4105]